MKSPIKDSRMQNLCIASLKKLIPIGSVVDVYGFYSGEVELNLCENNRFINARTNSYQVYEFWKCIEEDAHRVYEIATSNPFKFKPQMFPLLQENWHTYKDPYIRAALFFLLNRCSKNGLVSSGELDTTNFHPISVSYLKSFKGLNTLHVAYRKASDLSSMVSAPGVADYILIPCIDFTYNLFEEGKSRGVEETIINHRHLRKQLRSSSDRWILSYNYHPAIRSFFNKEHLLMIDGYGRLIGNEEKCKEMLVCNFPSSNTVV